MLAACQLTLVDHGGGVEEDVTDAQLGSPERLHSVLAAISCLVLSCHAHLIDITSQSRAAAALQMRLPVVLVNWREAYEDYSVLYLRTHCHHIQRSSFSRLLKPYLLDAI